MCIHSMWRMKFSYCFSLHITPMGRPEQITIPSRIFQVSSAVLMLTQPLRSLPLNMSTNCGIGFGAGACPSGASGANARDTAIAAKYFIAFTPSCRTGMTRRPRDRRCRVRTG